MLIAQLALRDLIRDRFFLFCNVAVMVGILVPLLVLFGVKNGVYTALIGEMRADPANLQIDTQGNASFSDEDLLALRDWPEIAFMTPKVRGQFDFMNVRAVDGRKMRPALVLPSGAGDPTLPPGTQLSQEAVAVSAQLAAQLGLSQGMELQLITQAEGRARQMVLPVGVAVVLPETAVSGRAVLVPFPLLDRIEAFYESYSLPEYGIKGTRDLSERVVSYEGVRVYADRLENLAALQARMESHLKIGTSARTRDVEALLGLGRKLDLALGLTTALAALGLGAALAFGFWSDVRRKKVVLASIALLGVSGPRLALFPMFQALVTATIGIAVSFALYGVAGKVAAGLFGQGLPDEAALTLLPPAQVLIIIAGVLAVVLSAAGIAAWGAQRLDPASVLREGT